MPDDQQRPYYDPNAKRQPPDRALVIVPEPPRRDGVTWVYNWITQQYEAYRGEAQSKRT